MAGIEVRGASEHNLHDLDVDIGGGITVLVGVSGSGKSSLAFDTVYAEARRRFLDALSMRSPWARVRPPHVRQIRGLGPAVAVSQNELNRNPNSTVASASGLMPFLRVLFARFGEASCPDCGTPVRPLTTEARRSALADVKKPVDVLAVMARGASGSHRTLRRVVPDIVVKSDVISVPVARLGARAGAREINDAIARADQLGAIEIVAGPLSLLRAPVCPGCGRWVGSARPPEFRPGTVASATWRLGGLTLDEVVRLDVAAAHAFADALDLPGAGRATSELARRIDALAGLGLGYLGLDRPVPTLSRGEAQRVRIAQILVNRLEDLLHVLDEPSIGLHPREVRSLLDTLAKLPGPVVMVEHDPRAAALADDAIEIGPGAGDDGGRIVFRGTPAALWKADTVSGRRFSAKRSVEWRNERRNDGQSSTRPAKRDAKAADGAALVVRNATLRNLRGVTCHVPLGSLTVVTGPSGAGKTTLARDVVLASVEAGKAVGCDGVDGPGLRPVMVDQSPIGNNPRSNPATYTKVLDRIRNTFAKATGVSASAFSFNRAEGACEGCDGYGAIEVKLRWLAPSWVECWACEGARFRPEVLEHTIERHGRHLNIADVLDLPVSDALALLGDDKATAKVLSAMDEVGLGYLSLGQPSPSLSGGEAQRIRLARHLARVKAGDLLVLDEPTIGLHPHDVDRLLDTLDRLVSGGATVLVVEHQEDVIVAADHVIDLGPGAGPEGGTLVREGRPRRADLPPIKPRTKPRREPRTSDRIRIRGAAANNLRDVDVDVPKGKFVVVTGLSGSGKSSLVGDVLEAEASRRLLECLSMYERQGTREGPESNVRSIDGLGPTVVLDGRRYLSRTTTGEATGVSAHVATLLSRIGVGPCDACGELAVRRSSPLPEAHRVCADCGAEAVRAEPRHFSPNLYAAACIGCGGVGFKQIPSEAKLIKDPTKSVRGGAFVSPGYFPRSYLIQDGTGGNRAFKAIAAHFGFDIEDAWQDIPEAGRHALLWGARNELGRWHGILPILATEVGDLYTDRVVCEACSGERLRPPYHAIELATPQRSEGAGGCKTRRALNEMPLRELRTFLAGIEVPEILATSHNAALRRLEFLALVGLDYVHLDRLLFTLSAGEAQRVRLAAVIGSDLRDLTVLLDEPTRGLHAREVDALSEALVALARQGNTVLVVEHDAAVIRRADHVIEMGPGSGMHGGRVMTKGVPSALKKGVTRDLLGGRISLPTTRERRVPKDWIVVRAPRGNNLRADEVRLPLGVLGGVCGPSGSGKSTLVVDTVARALNPQKATGTWSSGDTRPLAHEALEAPPLRLVMMDQSRRGVQSPGEHLGVTNALRKRYAEHDPDAVELCDSCGGRGAITVDMVFLSSIVYPCDACDGTGYARLAHDISLRGVPLPELETRSLAGVLELWSDVDPIARPLSAAVRLNLGYLSLRQPTASMSGGECQRLRLADAIARKRQATPRLFVLDEPTVGLHDRDVASLVQALDEIVEAGDGVLVVEHHTGLLACCDWLVELDEGHIAAEGHPDDIARGTSPTAPYLAGASRTTTGGARSATASGSR